MGIQKLLPYVEKACRPCRISEFQDCTIAVDACCWLHKAAVGCADKLALGQRTDMYIRYCLNMVRGLLTHRIRVILVFDGASLPAKKQTNETRKQRRETAKEKGHLSLAQGDEKAANGFFRQSAAITSEMIGDVIEACQKLQRPDVQCIVAPYEADAQLAFLNLNKFADVVLSEDSDLILFGCQKIIFKFDQCGGKLYELDNLPGALGNDATKFDFTDFRRMCILPGCDYFDGIPGVGLQKASLFFRKVSTKSKSDMRKCLKRIPLVLNMRNVRITDDHVEGFIAAENTFAYQIVFDPETQLLVPLNPYPAGVQAEDMPYAGKLLDAKVAADIAAGILCPQSHRRRVLSQDAPKEPIKRRTPIKSPRKRLSKSPRTSRSRFPSGAAFQVDHVKTVLRSRESKHSGPTAPCASPLSTYEFSDQLTRSRYFTTSTPSTENDVGSKTGRSQLNLTASSSEETNTTTKRAPKRSIFEVLAEGEFDSEESGFFDSSGQSSIQSTPKSQENQTTKRYAFQDGGAPTLGLLSSMNKFNKFRYTGASQN